MKDTESIAVVTDGVGAAGSGILEEAQMVASMADSVAPVETGDSQIDASLGNLVDSWATQLSILAALSISLAITLTAVAGDYSRTEQAIMAAAPR